MLGNDAIHLVLLNLINNIMNCEQSIHWNDNRMVGK